MLLLNYRQYWHWQYISTRPIKRLLNSVNVSAALTWQGRLFHAMTARNKRVFWPFLAGKLGSFRILPRRRLYLTWFSEKIFHINSGFMWFKDLNTSIMRSFKFLLCIGVMFYTLNNSLLQVQKSKSIPLIALLWVELIFFPAVLEQNIQIRGQ